MLRLPVGIAGRLGMVEESESLARLVVAVDRAGRQAKHGCRAGGEEGCCAGRDLVPDAVGEGAVAGYEPPVTLNDPDRSKTRRDSDRCRGRGWRWTAGVDTVDA